jgi:hypothetical protein
MNFDDQLQQNLSYHALRPGQPCKHPGCASHLSHPCEGCGRYAAGMQSGPCPDAGRKYIEKLALNDALIYSFLMLKLKNDWTWEQALIAMVIKQDELNRYITDRLNDAISKRFVWNPNDISK